MKTKLFFIVAFLFIAAVGIVSCKKDTKEETPPAENYGTPTAVGTPTGAISSATIDEAGGSILSADGRLELIIPANALTAATTIGIQPYTNQTPGGSGVSYSLTPDGQQFSQPVTIRFHYDSLDVLESDIHVLGIAYQKPDHIWYSFETVVLDSASGTVNISTNHFTIYSMYKNLYAVSDHANIKVNETATCTVVIVSKAKDNDLSDEELPLNNVVNYPFPAQVSWTLNGSLQGNQDDGTIAPLANSITTTYTAPAAMGNMSSNPVTVTAEVSGVWLGGASKAYLTKQVKVVGKKYFISVELVGVNVNTGVLYINYTDSSSFLVDINENNIAEITDITPAPSLLGTLTPNLCVNGNATSQDQGNYLDITSVIAVASATELQLTILNLPTTATFIITCPSQLSQTIPGETAVIPLYYGMPAFSLDGAAHNLTLDLNNEAITITAYPQ
jgi:hypothetical protein